MCRGGDRERKRQKKKTKKKEEEEGVGFVCGYGDLEGSCSFLSETLEANKRCEAFSFGDTYTKKSN